MPRARSRTRVSGFYGFIPRSIFCELPRACVCVCVCSGGEQGSIQALSLYAFMYRHNAAVLNSGHESRPVPSTVCGQVCFLGTLCARDTLIACSSSHAPAECVGGSQRERHSVRVILRRIDRDAWMTKGGGISDHGQAPERRRSLSPGSGRRGRGAAPWASGWASATVCRRVGCWDQGHLGRRDPWIWVILTVRQYRHAAPLASRVSPSRATASPPEPCHRANRRHRPGSRSPTGRRATRRASACGGTSSA